MAFKNKLINFPDTGQQIKFLQTSNDTDGRLLEMLTSYRAHSKEPAAHYHPYQEEKFSILFGELSVRMDGKIFILKRGDTIHIPKNKVHSMWNNSEINTLVNWQVCPALKTENLLEIAAGLANDGLIKEDGMPQKLQKVLMANKFSSEFRLAKVPFIIQKIIFVLLTPIAYLAGYRPFYKKYLD